MAPGSLSLCFSIYNKGAMIDAPRGRCENYVGSGPSAFWLIVGLRPERRSPRVDGPQGWEWRGVAGEAAKALPDTASIYSLPLFILDSI